METNGNLKLAVTASIKTLKSSKTPVTLQGLTIDFSATAGFLDPNSVQTDAQGEAQTVLTLNRKQTAVIMAQHGDVAVKAKVDFTMLGAGNVSKMGKLVPEIN